MVLLFPQGFWLARWLLNIPYVRRALKQGDLWSNSDYLDWEAKENTGNGKSKKPLKPHVGQQLRSSFALNSLSAQATLEEAALGLNFCFLSAPDQVRNEVAKWPQLSVKVRRGNKNPNHSQTRYTSACSSERETETRDRAISVLLSHLVLISLSGTLMTELLGCGSEILNPPL